jgi:hypothetical protein
MDDDFLEVETGDARQRQYWATRHGADPGRISLDTACGLLQSLITSLRAENYLTEWTGYGGPVAPGELCIYWG